MESAYQIDRRFGVVAAAAAPAPPPSWLNAVAREEIGDGMCLNRFDFVAEDDHRMQGEGPPTFCIAVFLEGRGTMSVENGPSLRVEPNMTVLFHTPRPVRGEHRIAAGCRVRCLDLRSPPDLPTRLGMPALPVLMRAFPADCSVQDILLVARPTPAPLTAIARDVFACRLNGTARRFYMRAKALEAFAQIIAITDPGGPESTGLTRRDRERVREAAALLTARYQEPWTIASLAGAVGLNDRKLKTGFRLIVGRTVHAHLVETRLAAAAHLLADGRSSVTEAALAVGYDNLSYFAKLFRRRHGILPSDWRRRSD